MVGDRLVAKLCSGRIQEGEWAMSVSMLQLQELVLAKGLVIRMKTFVVWHDCEGLAGYRLRGVRKLVVLLKRETGECHGDTDGEKEEEPREILEKATG